MNFWIHILDTNLVRINIVWEGNMKPMMKRHVSIFKRLIYFGYLGYLGYLGYPRYPGYPKHSGGTSGTLWNDTKVFVNMWRDMWAPSLKKISLMCQKIRKYRAAKEETAACHASESAKSVILWQLGPPAFPAAPVKLQRNCRGTRDHSTTPSTWIRHKLALHAYFWNA